MLLLILLLLLNVYPLISARDAVFQEKEKAMESQAATLASALASLDNPDQESIAEVLRFLDIQGYDRIIVAGKTGDIIYDTQTHARPQTAAGDLLVALGSKTVFRLAGGRGLLQQLRHPHQQSEHRHGGGVPA